MQKKSYILWFTAWISKVLRSLTCHFKPPDHSFQMSIFFSGPSRERIVWLKKKKKTFFHLIRLKITHICYKALTGTAHKWLEVT